MADCPSCTGPVSAGSSQCEWCRLRLAADPSGRLAPVFPEIRPGDVLVSHDFRKVPLPTTKERSHAWGNDTAAPHADGVVLTLLSPGMLEFAQPYLRLRDGCTRLEATTLDPGMSVRVMFRYFRIGQADLRYELAVRQDRQQFWISRLFSSAKESGATLLHPHTTAPSLRPLGEPNALELRLQGPTVKAFINDVHVCTVHDPALGVGRTGVAASRTAEADGKPTRVVFHSLEVRTVAP